MGVASLVNVLGGDSAQTVPTEFPPRSRVEVATCVARVFYIPTINLVHMYMVRDCVILN